MLNFSSVLKDFQARFTNATIKHILLNWSSTEVGLRHPNAPVGFIARDQGQSQLFAGKSNLILEMKGDALLKATRIGINGKNVNISTDGPSGLQVNGKIFSSSAFNGSQALFINSNTDISSYGLVGPGTFVLVNGSPIPVQNSVPIDSLFNLDTIFDPNSDFLPNENLEYVQLFAGVLS